MNASSAINEKKNDPSETSGFSANGVPQQLTLLQLLNSGIASRAWWQSVDLSGAFEMVLTPPEVSIVVPSYREGPNLPELCDRIAAAMGEAGTDFEIIIVDDNSPDDTEHICSDLADDYPVRLFVRKEERGLSSAVIAGLRIAHGDVLVVMDADLSHPPEKIPDLVALLDDEEVDFAIGSRYVKGGSTAEDWGFLRRLNSIGATLLARGLTNARDPMAGFFAIRRSTFEIADMVLDPIGFKIGLEIMVKAHCHRVAETPIRFANRKRGNSKLSWRQQVLYLRHLLRLYRYRFSTLNSDRATQSRWVRKKLAPKRSVA